MVSAPKNNLAVEVKDIMLPVMQVRPPPGEGEANGTASSVIMQLHLAHGGMRLARRAREALFWSG